jgi:hypothetical protein
MALTEPRQEDGLCRRTVGRALLSFPCKLELSEGKFKCVLEDLSLSGARVNCSQKIDPGRQAWLIFDRFKVFGTITRCHGLEYGIEFEEHIPKSIILEMQEHAVDLEAYDRQHGMVAAKDYVIGETRIVRSPLMRLLDIVGPISREKFSDCLECERGVVCLTHCGHKKFKRVQLIRVVFYLALAAMTGAAIGVGSLLFG